VFLVDETHRIPAESAFDMSLGLACGPASCCGVTPCPPRPPPATPPFLLPALPPSPRRPLTPSLHPIPLPTNQPTNQPTSQPANQPASQPSNSQLLILALLALLGNGGGCWEGKHICNKPYCCRVGLSSFTPSLLRQTATLLAEHTLPRQHSEQPEQGAVWGGRLGFCCSLLACFACFSPAASSPYFSFIRLQLSARQPPYPRHPRHP